MAQMTRSWHGIWSRRRPPGAAAPGLEDLLAADGFDVLGHVDVPAWQAYVDTVAERLGIAAGDSLFDVGCGAGAFLYPFHAAGHPVGGLDYSPPLLATARRAMPDGAFEEGEAIALRSAVRYDWVCANGLFLYFPDADYASGVLKRMAAKARKGIAILDVPDLATRDQALAARRAAYTGGDYEADYRGLEHLFLARDWWPEQAAALGLGCEVRDQHLAGYLHAPYRYNLYLHKRGAAA
jgi:SAM-dependent methyltransferase